MIKLVKTPAPKKRKLKSLAVRDPEAFLNQPIPDAIDWNQVTYLTIGNAANGDKYDPVVFVGPIENQARGFFSRYGFDRLPLTIGELDGVHEYIEMIDTAIGINVFDPERTLIRRKTSMPIWHKYHPELTPAVTLLAAGDLVGLTKLHRDEDTMKKLGENVKFKINILDF
jgi:hypothetical protein